MKNHKYHYNYTMATKRTLIDDLKELAIAGVGLFAIWALIVMAAIGGGY